MFFFDWIYLHIKRLIERDIFMMLFEKYFVSNIKINPRILIPTIKTEANLFYIDHGIRFYIKVACGHTSLSYTRIPHYFRFLYPISFLFNVDIICH